LQIVFSFPFNTTFSLELYIHKFHVLDFLCIRCWPRLEMSGRGGRPFLGGRDRQRELVYTTYYAGCFNGSEARPTKVDLVSSLRPSRTYVRFLSLGFFLNLVSMAFPLILACAVFRFSRREAFTALGLSCVRAVCWESLPGWPSYAVEFLGLVGTRSSSCSSARDRSHCRRRTR
jgi:hypothetical protein